MRLVQVVRHRKVRSGGDAPKSSKQLMNNSSVVGRDYQFLPLVSSAVSKYINELTQKISQLPLRAVEGEMKSLTFGLLLFLAFHAGDFHSYHLGGCPNIEPQRDFDMNKVSFLIFMFYCCFFV